MEFNNENMFGRVNSFVVGFNPDISESSKYFEEAEGSCRKGKWCPREDGMLIKFVEENGTKKENGKVEVKWGVVARKLNRTYKSCRLRWYNQLAPGISFERFSPEEDDLIIRMVHEIGPIWSKIAEKLKCRTDNQVKNRWNSVLKNVQRQKMPEKKVSSRRVTQTLQQGETSTHGNMKGSFSSFSSDSTLLLFSNSTSAGPIDSVPPPASLHVLPPHLTDDSLYCPLSPALDTPDPSAHYSPPDPSKMFYWLYSPSLHPPGSEIPDVYPHPYAFNPTQEMQCAPVGEITEPMELGVIGSQPGPQKPACYLPGFD